MHTDDVNTKDILDPDPSCEDDKTHDMSNTAALFGDVTYAMYEVYSNI